MYAIIGPYDTYLDFPSALVGVISTLGFLYLCIKGVESSFQFHAERGKKKKKK